MGNRAAWGVLRQFRGASLSIKIFHNLNRRCSHISAPLLCHVNEYECYLVGIQELRNSMWVGKSTLASMENGMDWGSMKWRRQIERLCNTPRMIDNWAYCRGDRACISVSRSEDSCTNPYLYITFVPKSPPVGFFFCHSSNILVQCKLTHTHTHIHVWQILLKYEHSHSG